MPAAMMSETVCPAAEMESKAASSTCTVSGRRTMRSVIEVATPSVPSEPTKTPGQIVTGRIERRRAQVDQLARRQHHVQRQHVRWW